MSAVRSGAAAVALALGLLLVSGCGADESRFGDEAAAVRAAADAGDPAAADAAIGELEAAIEAAITEGTVDESEAGELRALVARTRDLIGAEVGTTTTTTQAPPEPAPAPEPDGEDDEDDEDDDDEKGDGKGKKKGKGND